MNEPTEMEMRVAIAICQAVSGPWTMMSEDGQASAILEARAAIQAMHGRGTVWPEGVTDAMVMAYDKNYGPHGITETLMACFNAAIDECSPAEGYVTARERKKEARRKAMQAMINTASPPGDKDRG